MKQPKQPDLIKSDTVIEKGDVTVHEPPSELLKVKAAIYIAGTAILLGTVFLAVALIMSDTELKAWATGLISLVVGAAIGFVFSGPSQKT